MFKSPVKEVPILKTPINFLKTVASPRQATRNLQMQTSKSINTVENDFTIDRYSKPSATNSILIEITFDKTSCNMKLSFSYSNKTTN
jgi:hypothetical protein